MEWEELTVQELRSNVTRAANWKLPDLDKHPTVGSSSSLHQPMASAFTQVLNNPEQTPE